MAGRTDDHLVEITFTTVAAYGSFLLADHFGFSGVLATITAGLIMSNFKSFGTISDRGKEAVQAFWEYAAFAANSLVFLLIGMREAHQNFAAIWLPALIAIVIVTLGRAIAVIPVAFFFHAPQSVSRGSISISCFGEVYEVRWRLRYPLDFRSKSRNVKRSWPSVSRWSRFRSSPKDSRWHLFAGKG